MSEETEKERWERNYADELRELRVAQTGVQILFAFLLTLPFSSGFPHVTAFQKDIYILSLLAAAAATALTISPVAFHMALFRQRRQPELVKSVHLIAIGSLSLLLVAMVSAVLLITDFVLPRGVAFLLSGITGLFFLTFWLGLPFARRRA